VTARASQSILPVMSDEDSIPEELEDPVTALQASVAQQREMYETWLAVGFTEHQSLELLKTFVYAFVMKPL